MPLVEPAYRHRRVSVGWLAGGLLALLLVFLSLNAFNLKFLFPRSSGQLFVFTGISVLVFLVLLVLLVLLFRNILKLYADERSRVLGSRIRTRMLLGALLLSLAPAFFLFLFSYLLMNRTIDRWFSQPVSQMRDDSTRVALELTQYAMANARAEAASLGASPVIQKELADGDYAAIKTSIAAHRITLEGGFVFVYEGGDMRASFHAPEGTAPLQVWNSESSNVEPDQPQLVQGPLSDLALQTARKSDEPILSVGTDDFVLAAAPVANDFTIVCGFPLPDGFRQTVSGIRGGARDYWTLRRARNKIRGLYLLVILLLTVLVFFTSSWLALFLSKGITRPVEALADAMDAIAKGQYSHRIASGIVKELGELVRSFNSMAADLERTRELAESSTAQLSDANRALQARRLELETILQTIPTGVIILNDELRMQQTNRAATDVFGSGLVTEDAVMEEAETESWEQPPLEMMFPADQRDDLWRMIRRCQRIGIAAGDFEFRNAGQAVNLTVTVALLEVEQQRRGYIMVLEDVTESLRGQRQVAWKEAAQRVAHEIKNPLTPIALSAGRIQRHLDRGAPESPAIIRRCSEVILNSVETMRTLVDEFAALAQFPVAQIRPVDLNEAVRSALDSFAGRLDKIHVVQRLAPENAMVAADAAGLTRALVNLIDNAAEAMQDSLLRELTIETALLSEAMMAEIVVADTGPGLTAEARERLFLPYFSTKQRGTGLGLAITAKIVQEHNGFIRAEQNHPIGARFIIEIPLAGAPSVASEATAKTGSVL